MPALKVTQRLFLTEDGKRVVPEGDPDGRWLWATPGMSVTEFDAKRYGLIKDEPEVVPEAEPEKAVETPRRKPGRPPGSKNRSPSENK